MKKTLFFYIVFLFPSIFFAQDVTGVWQGYVERSNPDCPSFPETFLVTFILEQNGNIVTGTSRSIVEGTPYFGFYELNGGNLNNNILLFGADLVQDIPPPGSAWCDGVIGELEYNEAENLLEGIVGNVTGSACCDGDVYLKRLGLLSDSIQCQGELVELEVTGENVQWYADENLDSLLGTGNTLEVIINEPTSFYITQSFVGEETTPIQIDIDIYEQQITDYEIIITNACNDNSGTIEVLLENEIDALFQINDNDFSNNNILEGLSAANYSLTIQDENGCQVDTSFQIINESVK